MKTGSICISYRLAPKIVMLSIICAVSSIHPLSAYGAPAHIEFVQSASTVDAYDFVEVTLGVGGPDAGKTNDGTFVAPNADDWVLLLQKP